MNAHTAPGSRKDDGFSLAELAITLAILSIIAAIAIPVFLNGQEGASNKVTAEADLSQAATSVSSWLSGQRGAPEEQVTIASSGSQWAAVAGDPPLPVAGLTGTLGNPASPISGTVYTDGSWCVSSTIAGAATHWSNLNPRLTAGDCPQPAAGATGLGGTGTVPDAVDVTLPDSPTGVTVDVSVPNTVTVTWPVDPTVDSYIATLDGKRKKTRDTLTDPTESVTWNNVPRGEYAVAVRAVTSAGRSPATVKQADVTGSDSGATWVSLDAQNPWDSESARARLGLDDVVQLSGAVSIAPAVSASSEETIFAISDATLHPAQVQRLTVWCEDENGELFSCQLKVTTSGVGKVTTPTTAGKLQRVSFDGVSYPAD